MIYDLKAPEGLAYLERYVGPVVGIDEVGVGACAGPLLVAGVLASSSWCPAGVEDSKRLHAKRAQDVLKRVILPEATHCHEEWMAAGEVDYLGVAVATQLLTHRVYEVLRAISPRALVVLDGSTDRFYNRSAFVGTISFPKADGTVPTVSAASILAKVRRDRYMELLDLSLPEYSFGRHKGYYTTAHWKAIQRYGLSEEHRRSFRTRPLK